MKALWDDQNILLETDSSDVTQVIYTLEPSDYGNLVSQRRGATTSFFHFDAVGSTDRLTDSSAASTDSYLYEAFGTTRVSSGATANPFKYVGRMGYYFDSDIGLHLLRARYYDSATGRFISRDFETIENYRYAFNWPTLFVDPDARFAAAVALGFGILTPAGWLLLGVLVALGVAMIVVGPPKVNLAPRGEPTLRTEPRQAPRFAPKTMARKQPKPQPQPRGTPDPLVPPRAKPAPRRESYDECPLHQGGEVECRYHSCRVEGVSAQCEWRKIYVPYPSPGNGQANCACPL